MKKFGFVIVLYLATFVAAIGQELVRVRTIPEGNTFTLLDAAKPGEKKERVVVDRGGSANFDRADPNMPIAVPPKDPFSKFPVKDLPEDYPSDMPVAGPSMKCPLLPGRIVEDGDG